MHVRDGFFAHVYARRGTQFSPCLELLSGRFLTSIRVETSHQANSQQGGNPCLRRKAINQSRGRKPSRLSPVPQDGETWNEGWNCLKAASARTPNHRAICSEKTWPVLGEETALFAFSRVFFKRRWNGKSRQVLNRGNRVKQPDLSSFNEKKKLWRIKKNY